MSMIFSRHGWPIVNLRYLKNLVERPVPATIEEATKVPWSIRGFVLFIALLTPVRRK